MQKIFMVFVLLTICLGAVQVGASSEANLEREQIQNKLKEAEDGDLEAQIWLGHVFLSENTGSADYTQAVRWYARAAKNGSDDARAALGVLYFLGLGVEEARQEEGEEFVLFASLGDKNCPEAKGLQDKLILLRTAGPVGNAAAGGLEKDRPFARRLHLLLDEAIAAKNKEELSLKNTKTDPRYLSSVTVRLSALGHKRNRMGYIDNQGNWIVKPRFYYLADMNPEIGLALAAIYTADGVKYGYVNSQGRWVVPPRFTQDITADNEVSVLTPIGDFSADGLAKMRHNGKWGYIDRQGNWAISPRFDDDISFNFALGPGPFANGVANAHSGGLYGVVNMKGEWITRPQFQYIGEFADNGLARAWLPGGLGGYLNTSGQWAIAPQYKRTSDFSNGLACVEKSDRFFYIDARGNEKFTIRAPMLTGDEFSEYGLAKVYGDGNNMGLRGYVDKEGNLLFKHRFYLFGDFTKNGLAWAMPTKEGPCGYIDIRGNWVIKPNFVLCGDFEPSGLADVTVVAKQPSHYINEAGETVFSWEERCGGADVNKNLKGERVWPPRDGLLQACISARQAAREKEDSQR